MSMETHVFFRGPLPRKAALRRAMRELGFPFTLVPDTGALKGQSGFMPMRLRGEDTGVEFDVFEGREAIDEFSVEGIDPAFDRCGNFRWGGDETEMLAGLCAAAALAKLVDGVVFDEMEDRLLTVGEAVAVARKNLDALRRPEEPKHPGTRPADIKRYLKPLLKLRPDLVLCGRHLLIRPVRHLLRGVALGRTYDKYKLSLYRHINPLYGDMTLGGFGDNLLWDIWKVWQPYFLPLLVDSLAEDVFEPYGPITSLNGFADWLESREPRRIELVRTLLLAGERDRAVALAERFEREPAIDELQAWCIKERRALLERDLASICADAHRGEAANVKSLGLEKVWEPSPFPVELPAAARQSVDELSIVTTPWLPRTSGLVVEAPERTGEMQFADMWVECDNRIVLLAPLTREEAARRHEARESYCLATRLSGGELLVFHHSSDWHPSDPERSQKPDRVHNKIYYLWVHGTTNRLFAEFSESWLEAGQFALRSVDVRTLGWTTTWHCHNDVRARQITIHDPPSDRGERGPIHRHMSDSDVALCVRELPAFGEFEDLLERANVYLSLVGYGRVTSQLT
jgi:hypothetical protein